MFLRWTFHLPPPAPSPGSRRPAAFGLDPARPLDAQGDGLCRNTAGFEHMTEAFFGAERVVRGLDPEHRGAVKTPFTLSLDGGCGFGGELIAAAITPNNTSIQTLSA